jgi:hypothetical protein
MLAIALCLVAMRSTTAQEPKKEDPPKKEPVALTPSKVQKRS